MTTQTIRLNQRELHRLAELFDSFNQQKEYGSVTLTQHVDNGIGQVLTATFVIQHRDVDGEFTVTITDQENW
jgi:hypothetical protein